MCTPITFITGNPEKIIEIQEIIGSTFPRKLILRLDIDLPELQGEIEEIAIKKVLEATRYQTGPILCEDASLCFNALNGLPGPYVKWFQSKIGPCGLYRLLKDYEDKSAEAVCTLAYHDGFDCGSVRLFQGRAKGTIVSPRGKKSFTWDSIFMPEGFNKTYGEMSKAMKNKISHRFNALDKLRRYFLEHPE